MIAAYAARMYAPALRPPFIPMLSTPPRKDLLKAFPEAEKKTIHLDQMGMDNKGGLLRIQHPGRRHPSSSQPCPSLPSRRFQRAYRETRHMSRMRCTIASAPMFPPETEKGAADITLQRLCCSWLNIRNLRLVSQAVLFIKVHFHSHYIHADN